ncbi:MAG: site-specific DNA-methyltransferase [Desulfobacteraceae bacterium IS3]|nr:MAG: site-specific DNA-methyltransferase [Desulfobacteraceae bacterium IS3]
MDTYPIFQTPKEIETRFHSSADIVLYHGDALQFVSTIPDNTISLIITSPPYNLGKKYENQVSISKYLETQEEIISQLYRILRQDGSLCWQVGNYVENGEVYPLDILYYQIFKNLGMYLRNRIIWYFGHGLHASKRFSGRYETLLWFTKSDHYVFNLDPVRIPSKYPGKRYYKGPNIGKLSGNPYGKNPSDVWEFIAKEWDEALWNIPNVKSNHPEKTIHPCQYPIELVERCVLALTKKNDWVYDPYAGVGSALLAALIHGRKAAGSEKEQEYVKIARDRIRDYYNGTLKIRPIGRPVHEPTGKEKIVQIPQEWSELFNTGADL